MACKAFNGLPTLQRNDGILRQACACFFAVHDSLHLPGIFLSGMELKFTGTEATTTCSLACAASSHVLALCLNYVIVQDCPEARLLRVQEGERSWYHVACR